MNKKLEVKICGITTEEEANFIKKVAPDFMGMVLFFPKSKRNIDIEKAAHLIKIIGNEIKKVAVVVSPDIEQVEQIEKAGFDYIQIHNELSKEVLEKINIPIIRAYNGKNIEEIDKYINDDRIYGFLFDAASPGSGKAFEWNQIPKRDFNNKKIFLAGGLTPQNLMNIVGNVQVDVVDVSSGVENDNGIGKDFDKIEAFINNAKEASALEEYIENIYTQEQNITDETDYIGFWEKLIEGIKDNNVAQLINERLCKNRPVKFIEPDGIKVYIQDFVAGKIAIVELANNTDFENFLINFAHKGVRPKNIEETGASFLFGKYTRVIVLSRKYYSNVTETEMELDKKDWLLKSLIIRKEHESIHFFTKNRYGMSRNNLHDELMADFFGIYAAFGYYKAEYFLRFIGVIEGNGDRLKCYTEGLSEAQSEKLKQIAKVCAYNLEKWSQSEEFLAMSYEEKIKTLCEYGIRGIYNNI